MTLTDVCIRKDPNIDLYTNEAGKIGLLVSPGYGAGWSTWNDASLAYDRRVIEYWLAHKDSCAWCSQIASFSENAAKKKAKDFFASIGYKHVYLSGLSQCILAFVNPGTPFRITEYDGSETLEIGLEGYTIL